MSSPLSTLRADWVDVQRCPACGCRERACLGKLRGDAYRYHEIRIPFPNGGVSLWSCVECGLVYKTEILSVDSISLVCKQLQGRIWTSDYDYGDEKQKILSLMQKAEFDLLDVGVAGGGLLKTCSGYAGRRSGLDVSRDCAVDQHLRGEFILGSLEDRDLDWSGVPYDVVTMFDVVEHFVAPDDAFSHLRQFVKPGGWVIVETGDVESSCPRRYGPENWWYATRFPHVVFWSVRSLCRVAEAHGFQLMEVVRKRNKSISTIPWRSSVKSAVKAFTYSHYPRAYRWIITSREGNTDPPRNPLSRDHIRMVLWNRG